MSNSLDPDQDQHSVGPDLGQNCLQRLSAVEGIATSKERLKIGLMFFYRYSKFAYEDIREVHKRRYLLQPIAIEVFSSDGRNYLLAFPRKVRNKVYSK